MTTGTHASSPSNRHAQRAKRERATSALDLDALARMNTAALADLYESGTTPADLRALDGHPRGRMLAVRALDRGLAFGLLRRLARASGFPWGGKSFSAGPGGATGTGINRVALAGRHQLFPFHTRVQPSVIDDAPCVALDYDLPDNPALIRAIHDEVREVVPGLFLGPAMVKTGSRPALVLWFALDTRTQARAIGLARETK